MNPALLLPTGPVQRWLQPARQQHRDEAKASAAAKGAAPGTSSQIWEHTWESADFPAGAGASVWKEDGGRGRSQRRLVCCLSERRRAALLWQVSQSFSSDVSHPHSQRVPQVRDRLSLSAAPLNVVQHTNKYESIIIALKTNNIYFIIICFLCLLYYLTCTTVYFFH